MHITTRWILGIPAAGLITGGLCLAMIGLIRTEFSPLESAEVASFDLSPVVEDMKVIERKTVIEEFRKVDTPPPPPRLSSPASEAPSVDMVEIKGEPMRFDPTDLDMGEVKLIVPNRGVQPLVRVPPVMPTGAERSGHCQVSFDVSPDGSPYNVRATYCSSSIFKRATEKSVERWVFEPEIRNGVAVGRTGVENVVRFNLMDERGAIIPE